VAHPLLYDSLPTIKHISRKEVKKNEEDWINSVYRSDRNFARGFVVLSAAKRRDDVER
jgi:hypothetical protein